MNDTAKKALDFAERADKYYVNCYNFNTQSLTDIAKCGLDARVRLIEAIEYIGKLAAEIKSLEEQLNSKDSQ
jgi:hypothetical protein